MAEREILTEMLARVEGEGAMEVRIRDGRVHDVKLRIYEPPRFFEAFLRGRRFTEVPDITARICGICPVAYQMSSIAAMEDVCGVEVADQIRALRRMLYCGEWVESHALHVFMLHAPDFLGYANAFEMARDHADVVERALQLKKAGNARRRLLPRADAGRARAGDGGARARPRVRDRRSEVHRVAAVPRLRGGLRLPRAARSGRLRDRGRAPGVEHRARSRAGAVRRAHRREARRALDRAAFAAARRHALPRRPAGSLCAQPDAAFAGRARGRRCGRP
jgi:hypothetical protein